MRLSSRSAALALAATLGMAGLAPAVVSAAAPPAPASPTASPSPTALGASPTAPGASLATELSQGVPVAVSGAAGSMTYWQITLPAGATDLKVGMSGGTGDADLYLKAGGQPSATSYDCRPYQSGTAESCTVARPVAGTYGVALRGYSAYSDVRLVATWTAPVTTSTTSPATSAPAGDPVPAGPWGEDLSLAVSTPREDSKYPAKSNPELDALRYHLDLDWDGSRLKGTTTLAFRATQQTATVRLDLLNALAVSAVTLDGTPVTWSTDSNGLIVSTGQLAADSRHTLVIAYAGTPATVPMPSSRTDVGGLGFTVDPVSGDVSTLQEPYGAFTWYPCNDIAWDKAYYTARITAPAGRQGVFNGQRTATTTAGGRTVNTFVLDRPASPYLTTLAIGDYSLETRTLSDGTPFHLWYEPQDVASLSAIWSTVTTSWNWLTGHLAPYPFASAGMVLIGKGSAMETQTLVTMNRRYATGGTTFLHETAHQWNGDSVTTWDWKDLWLNEGWALFWELENTGSTSDAALGRSCISATSHAGPAGDFDPNAFGEYNVYACGARALRQIRGAVGTSAFTAMAKGWQEHRKYRNATRADFVAYVRSATGYDPAPVLDNWLGASPHA